MPYNNTFFYILCIVILKFTMVNSYTDLFHRLQYFDYTFTMSDRLMFV